MADKEDRHLNYSSGYFVQGEKFVLELLSNQKKIYTFIFMLVGNRSDADDIMQETASEMWCKYRGSSPIENFSAWGVQIAHYKVLAFRKQRYKERVQFNSELFETFVGAAASISEELDDRVDALRQCLSKLNDRDRKLVSLRHKKNMTTKEAAKQIGISVDLAYKNIAKIHEALLRCIHRTLRAQGAI
jgi:RNA polymerase sigma-70 factor (ECF subfamily)